MFLQTRAMLDYATHMNVLRRIAARSGELSFDEEVDHSCLPLTVPAHYRMAISMLPSVVGKNFVDIGCWTGGLLRLLRDEGANHLIGLDIPGSWLSYARKSVPEATFYEITSISEFPSDLDGKFDHVMFLETIEHIPRKSEASALNRISKLLNPNGMLILSTPAAGIAQLLDPAWYLVGHRHYRLHKLESLINGADMEIMEVRYWGDFVTMINVILMYVWKHLFHRTYKPLLSITERTTLVYSHRRTLFSTGIWISARPKSASSFV